MQFYTFNNLYESIISYYYYKYVYIYITDILEIRNHAEQNETAIILKQVNVLNIML